MPNSPCPAMRGVRWMKRSGSDLGRCPPCNDPAETRLTRLVSRLQAARRAMRSKKSREMEQNLRRIANISSWGHAKRSSICCSCCFGCEGIGRNVICCRGCVANGDLGCRCSLDMGALEDVRLLAAVVLERGGRMCGH